MVLFTVVIPGVIFVVALSVMLRSEAKSVRRDASAVDPMFAGKKR